MNIGGKEIERKFLIGYPDHEILAGCEKKIEIEQTYLAVSESGGRARVRKSVCDGQVTYTHTEKIHITNITRIENERSISAEEYSELLKSRDTERNTIRKTRYILEHCGQSFEIDVFPFWDDRAFMELELMSEDDEIIFPPAIKIIKEVTADKRYTNASLAVRIPDDTI